MMNTALSGNIFFLRRLEMITASEMNRAAERIQTTEMLNMLVTRLLMERTS